MTPDTWHATWAGFLDDARPLGDPPYEPHTSPAVADRAVADVDLPRLGSYDGDVRVVLAAGAGQVAGPAAYCTRNGIELSSLDVALRDADDPAGNARRVVAALDAAYAEGSLLEDTIVHVRLAAPAGPPTHGWLAAADVLAEAELVLAVSLDAGDPEPWIDAALDRELAVSLVGGTVDRAVAALRTTARLWGDEADLARARRWCRRWLTADVDAALAHLAGLDDAGVPR